MTVHYLHHGLNANVTPDDQRQQRGIRVQRQHPLLDAISRTYPRDIYEVLFNPLLFNAHGFGQRVAALENTVIVVLILTSLRNLRMVPRAAFARPYVMLCAVYTAIVHLHLRRPGKSRTDRTGTDHDAPLPAGPVVRPPNASRSPAPLRLGAEASGSPPAPGDGRAPRPQSGRRNADGVAGRCARVRQWQTRPETAASFRRSSGQKDFAEYPAIRNHLDPSGIWCPVENNPPRYTRRSLVPVEGLP